jgi:hypothetical protein
MKISNDPAEEKNRPFTELFRLQTEFQARLADETLRYLRRLQGAAAPASPGTVMIPGGVSDLKGAGAPGSPVELKLEVENLQRVHCTASPTLSPLVSASGITWFPESESTPVTMLVAPGATAELRLRVAIPAQLPPGVYRGCLMLHGFRDGALPVVIEVGETPKEEPRRAGSGTRPKPGASRKTRKKA